MSCYFDDIIRLENFDFDNIYISYKTLTDPKPLRIRFDKQMDLLTFTMELDIYNCLALNNIALLMTESDIL